MSSNLPRHWALMAELWPELSEKVEPWRNYLNEDQTIPRKYKELMMVAMCAVLRYSPGIKTHAELAIAHGATKEELFATVAQTMTVGGLTAYREACLTLEEHLAK